MSLTYISSWWAAIVIHIKHWTSSWVNNDYVKSSFRHLPIVHRKLTKPSSALSCCKWWEASGGLRMRLLSMVSLSNGKGFLDQTKFWWHILNFCNKLIRIIWWYLDMKNVSRKFISLSPSGWTGVVRHYGKDLHRDDQPRHALSGTTITGCNWEKAKNYCHSTSSMSCKLDLILDYLTYIDMVLHKVAKWKNKQTLEQIPPPLASYPGHVGGGKWPGIHCLCMRKRFQKSSANESNYGQITLGCYAEKYQTRYTACSVAAVFMRRWLPETQWWHKDYATTTAGSTVTVLVVENKWQSLVADGVPYPVGSHRNTSLPS